MLPGKQYKPEDILRIAWRRFWLLIVPAALIGAGTAVVVRTLPNRYAATTTILVVSQRVPENLVPSVDASRFEDRLRTMQETILSRSRLDRIILEDNLYAEERRTEIMQDVVERMRRDIDVRSRAGDTFTVTYTGDSPRAVRDVANKLAGLFIAENTKDRSDQAELTTQFFESELKDVEARLREAEAKREDFRKRYSGQLPDQMSGNQAALSGVQNQLRTSAEALNREGNRKRDLERELAALELAGQAPPETEPIQPTGDGAVPVGTTEQQLRTARQWVAANRGRYTDEHPEMVRLRAVVADLEKKLQAEALARPLSEPAPVRPEEARRLNRIQEIREELLNLTRVLGREDDEQRRLQASAADLQRRIDGVPALESAWIELNRNYDTLNGRYQDLLGKSENAKMAANMQRRQIGEQFKTLDSAVMPSRPISPDRPFLTAVGLAAGLGLGLLTVGFLEYRDSTFKTDTEVARLLTLPVLAVVPLMQSDDDRSRSRRLRWLVTIGCGTTVVSCLAVVAYTLIR